MYTGLGMLEYLIISKRKIFSQSNLDKAASSFQNNFIYNVILKTCVINWWGSGNPNSKVSVVLQKSIPTGTTGTFCWTCHLFHSSSVFCPAHVGCKWLTYRGIFQLIAVLQRNDDASTAHRRKQTEGIWSCHGWLFAGGVRGCHTGSLFLALVENSSEKVCPVVGTFISPPS